MNQLKIVTLNTANTLLENEQTAFLRNSNFDIICLQEISLTKFNQYKSDLAMQGCYHRTYTSNRTQIGIGILSRFRFVDTKALYFGKHERDVSSHEESDRVLLVVTIDPDNSGNVWNIANIHFTWSPEGLPNEQQRVHVHNLINVIAEYKSLILCGDFNAPRGGEIFSYIDSKYNDNVPKKYSTSIDSKNHRAGELDYMIDGVFSTTDFKATNFTAHSDLSDHLAFIATLKKSD